MARSFDRKTWDAAYDQIDSVISAGETAMHEALPAIGVEATNVIKVLVTHPPVSVPGEPPGLRTGGLRLSYDSQVSKTGPHRSVLEVGSDASRRQPITGRAVNYAKYLEFGTRLMKPRPHLRPGMALVTPMIGPHLQAAARAAMRAKASSLRGTSLR